MDQLKELIGEGEYIRSAISEGISARINAKISWQTVVRWYSDALTYAKANSSRPLTDLPDYLDDVEEDIDAEQRKAVHYERIDRLLNRLRGILARDNA